MTQEIRVWSWKDAFMKSELPPLTRLVLHTLSAYMNDVGESCYPSIDTITTSTGMSRTAVKDHLKNALEHGWLRKDKHGYGGQRWKRNEYFATYPDHYALKKGGAPDGPRSEMEQKGGADDDPPNGEGGAPDGQKVGRQTATNSPSISPAAAAGDDSLNDSKGETEESSQTDHLVEWFEAERVRIFGERAKRANVPQADYLTAMKLLDGEWGEEFVKSVIIRRMDARKSKGGQIHGLSYFLRAVEDEWRRCKSIYGPKGRPAKAGGKPAGEDVNREPIAQVLKDLLTAIQPDGNWEKARAASKAQWHDDDQWRKVCDAFRAAYGEAAFNSWLGQMRYHGVFESKYVLEAKTRFMAQHMKQEYDLFLKRVFGCSAGPRSLVIAY